MPEAVTGCPLCGESLWGKSIANSCSNSIRGEDSNVMVRALLYRYPSGSLGHIGNYLKHDDIIGVHHVRDQILSAVSVPRMKKGGQRLRGSAEGMGKSPIDMTI